MVKLLAVVCCGTMPAEIAPKSGNVPNASVDVLGPAPLESARPKRPA